MVTAVYDVAHVWCSAHLVNDQQIIFHASWTGQLPAGAAEHGSDILPASILHRDVFSFATTRKPFALNLSGTGAKHELGSGFVYVTVISLTFFVI